MDELISIVVSTYNWPEALDLSLKSLSAQTDSNFEIIGSSSKALSNFAPRELLSITQAKFLCKRLFRVLLKSFLLSLTTARGAKLLGLLRNGVAKVL